jgi:hypothetical protein
MPAPSSPTGAHARFYVRGWFEMNDPLPFLETEGSFIAIVALVVVLWYALPLRKSERGVRMFVWVAIAIFGLFFIHNALWGTCGRWGAWDQDFCTEPLER